MAAALAGLGHRGAGLGGAGRGGLQAGPGAAVPASSPAPGPSPTRWGWAEDQRWTLERVTTLIGRLLQVRYTLLSTSYLLHRWVHPQVPVHRAAERNEEAIATWRDVTWVKLRG